MKKIVDYILLRGVDNFNLSANVYEHIKRGWQPFGNPFLDKAGDFFQAMVIYET